MTRAAIAALFLLAAAPATADPLTDQVRSVLAGAGPGTRFGLVVTDEEGREIVAIAPDDRFVPASNTKIFTTALAFATLAVDGPDTVGGASVRIDGARIPDVILTGHGDARLSGAADCVVDCLAALADAVAARTRVVGNVIGDDTDFPDERWPQGMSWNNMVTRSGTAVSALTVDDNIWTVTVAPGSAGNAPRIASDGFYAVDDAVVTGATTDLSVTSTPGSGRVRIAGTIAAPVTLTIGIEDPAYRAAWLLQRMLAGRGVRVRGTAQVRHRPLAGSDAPRRGAPAPNPPASAALAHLVPPPLVEDLVHTNKASENLHAELLLRRVAAVVGSGSVADGEAAIDAMMARAGIARWRYDFADGSGMSNYNRVTPRGTAAFLRWTATQRWSAAWRATLPIAGVDGTLAHRFAGTPLVGHLQGKTGSLNAASALSGFMIAASGKTLVFASFANDMPGDASVRAPIDAALALIAAAN
ncbi:D-alanyl-D-alanine carboxypeptidase/D-alanyl-D-alanine endopeptidase [Sphingomonas oligophenolica]|uniref:D-alanyl-D-alanine carboxypeptidase/D-alanyl-D-alanine-endopeptidase n=1 Tax=Sphingomonas oligophenolica TaxID=301154 RepID=A0A502CN42_9SPHN|nr:D-alanyl-D-alanine carboxypeptidase/D-alanyl-D-alanine-endopeptidase [Sphingomonas oligophenolica]TPG14308.1 D-alanyl-D-alanine carboxypeptidase/D-alanyl-D-alanine-endopeptidase [Sphingomonas oligophenolica]